VTQPRQDGCVRLTPAKTISSSTSIFVHGTPASLRLGNQLLALFKLLPIRTRESAWDQRLLKCEMKSYILSLSI
jgi:hypothetical protein